MSWVAVAVGGSALIGGAVGLYSAKKQSSASEKALESSQAATVYGIDKQMEMFNLARSDFAPFLEAGQSAVGDLTGNKIPVFDNGRTTSVDKKYASQLRELGVPFEYNTASERLIIPDEQSLRDAEYNASPSGQRVSEFTSKLEGLEFPTTDPTGGAQKYIDLLDTLEFEFDPNDEIYKWRRGETEKAIDRFQSSRGTYNSSAAINALTNANMALQENEIGRQFEQNYLAKKDLYDLLGDKALKVGGVQYGADVNKYNTDYGKLLDLYKIKYGENSDEYNKLLNLVKIGEGAAGSTSAAALDTGTNLSNLALGSGKAQAQNYLNQGAISANLAQSLGEIPGNALLTYGYGKNAELW